MRLTRVLKLARFFPGMRKMLYMSLTTLKNLGPFAGLLFLFIYIFTLIGRELFAYKAILDDEGNIIFELERFEEWIISGKRIRYPRNNFNTFFDSLVAVFILINGEDWIWMA